MSVKRKFPFKIHDLTEQEKNIVRKIVVENFIKVGEKSWFTRSSYAKYGPELYNFPLNSDDMWVMGFVRSGTSVVQEMVWLMNNNFDVKRVKEINIRERFPTLEHILYFNVDEVNEGQKKISESVIKSYKLLFEAREKRLIKTHMPFGLFPKNLTNCGSKIIYVIRDPRDVIVSNYLIYAKFSTIESFPEFPVYWKIFKQNLVLWGPYFGHLKEAWKLRENKNVLMIFYNELIKNQVEIIHKIASFLGKTLTTENIDCLVDYCKTQFTKNTSDNHEKNMFVRKEHKWKKYFVDDLEQEVNQWIMDNLQDTQSLLSNFNI